MTVPGLLRVRLRHFAWGAVFLILTNLVSNTVPWVAKLAIDATGAGDLVTVRHSAWLLVGLAVVGASVRVLSRVAIFNGARLVEYDLRNSLFVHLTRLPASWYQGQTTGDLMSRVGNDVTYLRLLFGPGLLNVVNTAFAYAMALPLLLVIDVRLTVYTVIPVPIMLALSRSVARAIQTRQRAVQEELSGLSTCLQESLSGIGVVKALALERREQARFAQRNDGYLRESLRLVVARGLFMPLVGSISGVGMLIMLFAGGHAVAEGRITLGSLVAFMGYLAMLTWPTMALGWVISSWQRGLAALDRLREVLAVEPTIADPADPVPLPNPEGALEVRDLTVSRGGSVPALSGVSFAVPQGGSLGVAGRTGSGKSTLLHALARLVEVPGASVLLDGVDVTRLRLADLRGAFSLVPQDAFLFSISLRDNLCFGATADGGTVSDERVARAAADAALDRDVAAFPQGYDTPVGERGVTLSGGQRQRAAIARALLADRPVLVLDDALSSVDAETEQAIVAGLRRAATGRTTVVASHRLSGVAWCDRIIVLDDGRVVEEGSHDSLLSAGGWYAHTWALQQAEAAPHGGPAG